MRLGEFIKEHPNMSYHLRLCNAMNDRGGRLESPPYTFVKLDENKILFANLETLPASLPEIITLEGENG